MATLWSAGGPLTPAEVQASLSGDQAYTTVMTVLVRLWEKDLVERRKIGRAYAYEPALSEADLNAGRLRDVLAGTSDRLATMNRFVASLDPGEAEALRAALEELEQ
jgi:predicted transcriptional regulator